MREELSSLDLHYLVKEFQVLMDGKIDKTYQKDNLFVIQMYVPGHGKKLLKVILPGFIFLSETKEVFTEPGKFGFSLRKHISNARIRAVIQKEFERIIEIKLEARDKNFYLIFELFRPGNIILCDENYKIVVGLSYKGFGSRLVRPGAIYDYPKKEYNILEVDESGIMDMVNKSEKSSVVITLAIELGLGGMYAEELCKRAGIDKDAKTIDEKDAKKLVKGILSVLSEKGTGVSYTDKEKAEESVLDILPFNLEKYRESDVKEFNTFNEALDSHLTKKAEIEEKKEELKKHESGKNKAEGIIRQQETQIKGLEKAYEDNQKKGELIYEKYVLLETLLSEFKKAQKDMSLAEIKEKLKGHKIIKSVDVKEKSIVVDV